MPTGKITVSFEADSAINLDLQVLDWLLYNNVTVPGIVETMKLEMKADDAQVEAFLDGYRDFGGGPKVADTGPALGATAAPRSAQESTAAPAMAAQGQSLVEKLKAQTGLTEAKTSSVSNGRVSAGDEVLLSDDTTAKVEACYRGRLVVSMEDGSAEIVNAAEVRVAPQGDLPPAAATGPEPGAAEPAVVTSAPTPARIAPAVADTLRQQAAGLIEQGKTTPQQIADMLRSVGATGMVEVDGKQVEKVNFSFIDETRLKMVQDHLAVLQQAAPPNVASNSHGF